MGSKDQSQRGAAAVEFALLAPLFVAVLFAIVEFGLIIYTKSMLAQATREGARFGVVYTTPRRTAADIQAVVQTYLNQCGFTSSATVTTAAATMFPDHGYPPQSGDRLEVQVVYTYQFFVLPKILNTFMGGTLPTGINLQTDTVMRVE